MNKPHIYNTKIGTYVVFVVVFIYIHTEFIYLWRKHIKFRLDHHYFSLDYQSLFGIEIPIEIHIVYKIYIRELR